MKVQNWVFTERELKSDNLREIAVSGDKFFAKVEITNESNCPTSRKVIVYRDGRTTLKAHPNGESVEPEEYYAALKLVKYKKPLAVQVGIAIEEANWKQVVVDDNNHFVRFVDELFAADAVPTQLVRSMSRNIVLEARDMRSTIQRYMNRMEELRYFYENYPEAFSDIDREQIGWHFEDEPKDLATVTLEGDESPFFTEATLYPLLGKEKARTLLAAFEKTQQKVKLSKSEPRDS